MYWKSVIIKLVIPFTVFEIIAFFYAGMNMYMCECFSNYIPAITILAWLIFLIGTILVATIKKRKWKTYHALISVVLYALFLLAAVHIGGVLYDNYAPKNVF